ncbi:hypothetical protein BJY04DRAFT_179153 [Aspergillus karnatakaensis]|uniref:uncharacterized protein n=1 Tax=Aspergillus karnatakaensis TaxID=1810916 RepID=UPI003CCCB953
MTSQGISNILLAQAASVVVAQVFIVPRIITRWGSLRSFRWCTFLFPWLYCLTPFTTALDSPLSTVAIILDLLIKGLLVNIGYVASAILITNTSPAPIHLATINGAAASLSCLARSLGAAVSGSMFNLALKKENVGLLFWTLAGVAVIGASFSWFLRDRP